MEQLFSCRNCLHNSGQSLNIGNGVGYCLQHSALIRDSDRTTCKYLHRKDLPWFVVDEARSEHASEFAAFGGLADLYDRTPIKSNFYSERYAWENGEFDGLTNALARYHLSGRRWVFIDALTSGIDGRRAMAQASLTRRYMAHCDTWRSSFRLTLSVIDQVARTPTFSEDDINGNGCGESEALWDVFYSRISLIQEYGWHAGIEELIWVTDILGGLEEFDWDTLRPQLVRIKPILIQKTLNHARENDGYFATTTPTEDDEDAPRDEGIY